MTVDRRPLLSYLKVQEGWEAQMLSALQQSVERVDKDIARYARQSAKISERVRRAQLLEVKKALNKEISRLWTVIGSTVQASQAEAAAAAISSSLESTLTSLMPGITSAQVELLRQSSIQTAKQGVISAMQRLQGASYRPLSAVVYGSQNIAMGTVDRLVNTALARGLSAREIALQVRGLIDPFVRGGVSYAAMRLGRTEINNAFHATQVRYAAEAPWISGVRWNLSGSHPRGDICDDYADEVFKPEKVPAKPHPQCLCYMTDEVLPLDQVPNLDSYIDAKMREAGYTAQQIRVSR